MANYIRHVPWSLASGTSTSTVVDVGANTTIEGIYIGAGMSTLTWVAAKVGFDTYRFGSGTPDDSGGYDPQTQAFDGGPYSSSAAFDRVKDWTGADILLGNGTDTAWQVLMFGTSAGTGDIDAIRYLRIRSGGPTSTVQTQTIKGQILVRDRN